MMVDVAFYCDQIPALVHPVRALLASRTASADPVSHRVADPPSVSNPGSGRQGSARTGMDRRHATGARAAQTDRPLGTPAG
jgi:hypothetical protein